MRDSLSLANRYPDSTDSLAEKIASLHGVKPEQVVLGCGSTELLRMAAAAFLGGGKKIVMASPTFDLIARFARSAGSDVAAVPLTPRYAHDLNAMLDRVDASTGLVYVCNPNNPTGSLTLRKDLEVFLSRLPSTVRVLIDEAYHHYVGGSSSYASFVDQPVDDDRVIVTRTLSKIYGLAGLRIGYSVSPVELARQLDSERLKFGVSVVAARAAAAALGDAEHVRITAQRNANDRQEFYNQSNGRMLRVIDSQTNFVMLDVGRPANEIVEHFKKNNVLVAPRIPLFETHIRVSLGRPAEMKEFWRVWDLLPASHEMRM
jgi:histidinol-phosphate aminotransferase